MSAGIFHLFELMTVYLWPVPNVYYTANQRAALRLIPVSLSLAHSPRSAMSSIQSLHSFETQVANTPPKLDFDSNTRRIQSFKNDLSFHCEQHKRLRTTYHCLTNITTASRECGNWHRRIRRRHQVPLRYAIIGCTWPAVRNGTARLS